MPAPRRWVPAAVVALFVAALGACQSTSGPEGGLTIVTLDPLGPSYAVIELATGETRQYPPGVHQLPPERPEGVVMTPAGDAVVVFDDALYVVPGADFARAPRQIRPEWSAVTDLEGALFGAIPPADGSRLWLTGFPAVRGEQPGTAVKVVDLTSGDEVLDAFVPGLFEAVAATKSGLVLNVSGTDVARISDPAGIPGSALVAVNGVGSPLANPRVYVVGDDGRSRQVARGAAVAVHDGLTALVDAGWRVLSIVGPGGEPVAEVDPPHSEMWFTVGSTKTPFDFVAGRPLPTVSPSGDLLMSVRNATEYGGMSSEPTLFVVSLAGGTVEAFEGFRHPRPMATWTRDGRSVVVVTGGMGPSEARTISFLDPSDPAAPPVDVAAVPPGHYVVAAG